MAGAFSSAFSSAFDVGAGGPSVFKAFFLQVQELSEMLKNVASQRIGAQLVSATDGSAFTGSVTVSVCGDAGTQATGSVGSGACTHEGNGYHTYAPSQAETNFDLIAFTFTGTGAVPVTIQVRTWPATGLLAPTVLGRTLDVSAGGEAGIDLANVGSPTTTLNLSGTTISTSQAVASVTGSVNSVTGNVGGSVGSVLGNVGGNVTGSVGSVASYGSLVSDIATAVWGAGTRSLTTFGTLASDVWAVATRTLTAASDSSGVTTLLSRVVGTLASGTHNPQSGDSFARLGAPAGASIAADIAAEAVKTSGIKAKTDNLPADPADASDIAASFSTVNGTLATLATASNLANVAGYLDTEIAAILTIANRLDTMLELDGAVYRLTVNALEQAPSGGGGSTDWTADERTALRAILGIPASGTTPEVPSAGALKVIDDLLDTEIGALATAVADLPTNAELATALASSDDATLAAIAAEAVKTSAIQGHVDTLETELAKVIKSGEQITHVRAGKSNVTETITRG